MVDHDVLRDHALGKVHHIGMGACPDQVEGYETRDSRCPVCVALGEPEPFDPPEQRSPRCLAYNEAKGTNFCGLAHGVADRACVRPYGHTIPSLSDPTDDTDPAE